MPNVSITHRAPYCNYVSVPPTNPLLPMNTPG